MSTRININIDGDGLLNRSKSERLAYRQSFLLKENQKAAKEKGLEQRAVNREKAGTVSRTGEPITPVRNKNGSTGRGLRFLDQEPSARRSGEKTSISHFWLFEPDFTLGFATGLALSGTFLIEATATVSRTTNWLIGCGDGSGWVRLLMGSYSAAPGPPAGDTEVPQWSDPFTPTKVSKTYSTLAIPSISQSFIVLPTGGGNFILTVINLYYWNRIETSGLFQRSDSTDFEPYFVVRSSGVENYGGSTFSSFGEVEYFSFAINNQYVKAIDTPESFREKLAAFGPKIITVNTTVDVWPDTPNYQETFPFKSAAGSTSFALFSDSTTNTRLTAYNAEVYSPLVYEKINQVTPYTDKIQQVNSNYKGIISDARLGIYQKIKNDDNLTWQELYVAGDTLDYAQWMESDESPSLDVWEDEYEGPIPKELPRKTLTLMAEQPPGYSIPSTSVSEGILVAVTDWGDPIYCRNRAIELGFSASDMVAESLPV